MSSIDKDYKIIGLIWQSYLATCDAPSKDMLDVFVLAKHFAIEENWKIITIPKILQGVFDRMITVGEESKKELFQSPHPKRVYKNPIPSVPHEYLLFLSLGLFIALAPMPYGYYSILRLIISLSTRYIAYKCFKTKDIQIWALFFTFISILFNPLLPINMEKGIWSIIDACLGVLFVLLSRASYQNKQDTGQ